MASTPIRSTLSLEPYAGEAEEVPIFSESFTMSITSAIFNAHSDKINSLLADIEQQFTLDEDVLISITSHFHKLFNIGLSEYGHPMAMMCALTSRTS